MLVRFTDGFSLPIALVLRLSCLTFTTYDKAGRFTLSLFFIGLLMTVAVILLHRYRHLLDHPEKYDWQYKSNDR